MPDLLQFDQWVYNVSGNALSPAGHMARGFGNTVLRSSKAFFLVTTAGHTDSWCLECIIMYCSRPEFGTLSLPVKKFLDNETSTNSSLLHSPDFLTRCPTKSSAGNFWHCLLPVPPRLTDLNPTPWKGFVCSIVDGLTCTSKWYM